MAYVMRLLACRYVGSLAITVLIPLIAFLLFTCVDGGACSVGGLSCDASSGESVPCNNEGQCYVALRKSDDGRLCEAKGCSNDGSVNCRREAAAQGLERVDCCSDIPTNAAGSMECSNCNHVGFPLLTSNKTTRPPTCSSPTTTGATSAPPTTGLSDVDILIIVFSCVAGVIVLILVVGGIVIYCCDYRSGKKGDADHVRDTDPIPKGPRTPKTANSPMPCRKPKTLKPPPGFRATGPNAPFHYKAEDFHFRGPAKFDTRPLGVEDLPEPTSTETALSLRSKSEHVVFDKDLNEVYEIGPEVEEYLDRSNPFKAAARVGNQQQKPGAAPPGRSPASKMS